MARKTLARKLNDVERKRKYMLLKLAKILMRMLKV